MIQDGLRECPMKVGVTLKEIQDREAPGFKVGASNQEACFSVIPPGVAPKAETAGRKNSQVLCHAIPKRMPGQTARNGNSLARVV